MSNQNETKYLPLVSRAFANAGFLPEFGAALSKHESNWDPSAMATDPRDLARGGSRGLFQMSQRTAEALGYKGTPEGLFYPDTNTEWAVKLTLANLKALNGNMSYPLLAAAHNCGVTHAIKGTIPRETQLYVQAVLQLMKLYEEPCKQYRKQP